MRYSLNFFRYCSFLLLQAKLVSQQFKEMDDNEKKEYEDMAKKDKVRYQEEMKNYTPPKGLDSTVSKKNSKAKKDPNAPKRPMTAFMLFSNATRAKMKEDNPGISFGDVVSLILVRYGCSASLVLRAFANSFF